MHAASKLCAGRPEMRHSLAWHWLFVVQVLAPVHVAVRVPVYPLPQAPVQVPWNAVGLVQLLNVP
jgi:hypothetical protein